MAVRVDTERDANGHRTRKNLSTFATKKAAESAERKALDAVERSVDLDAKTTSLGEVVNRFLRDAGTRLSPSTAHSYAELWRLHAAARLGSIPIGRPARGAHCRPARGPAFAESNNATQPCSRGAAFSTHRASCSSLLASRARLGR